LEPARGEFRRRARAAFLSALAADPLVRPRPPRSVRFAVLAFAAAAILAVTFLLPHPAGWNVPLSGPVALAGVEYVPGDEARLGAELEGSGEVETRTEPARFALGGQVEVELRPGAKLSFPPLPELDGASAIAFELSQGEAYLRTAATYPGNPIR